MGCSSSATDQTRVSPQPSTNADNVYGSGASDTNSSNPETFYASFDSIDGQWYPTSWAPRHINRPAAKDTAFYALLTNIFKEYMDMYDPLLLLYRSDNSENCVIVHDCVLNRYSKKISLPPSESHLCGNTRDKLYPAFLNPMGGMHWFDDKRLVVGPMLINANTLEWEENRAVALLYQQTPQPWYCFAATATRVIAVCAIKNENERVPTLRVAYVDINASSSSPQSPTKTSSLSTASPLTPMSPLSPLSALSPLSPQSTTATTEETIAGTVAGVNGVLCGSGAMGATIPMLSLMTPLSKINNLLPSSKMIAGSGAGEMDCVFDSDLLPNKITEADISERSVRGPFSPRLDPALSPSPTMMPLFLPSSANTAGSLLHTRQFLPKPIVRSVGALNATVATVSATTTAAGSHSTSCKPLVLMDPSRVTSLVSTPVSCVSEAPQVFKALSVQANNKQTSVSVVSPVSSVSSVGQSLLVEGGSTSAISALGEGYGGLGFSRFASSRSRSYTNCHYSVGTAHSPSASMSASSAPPTPAPALPPLPLSLSPLPLPAPFLAPSTLTQTLLPTLPQTPKQAHFPTLPQILIETKADYVVTTDKTYEPKDADINSTAIKPKDGKALPRGQSRFVRDRVRFESSEVKVSATTACVRHGNAFVVIDMTQSHAMVYDIMDSPKVSPGAIAAMDRMGHWRRLVIGGSHYLKYDDMAKDTPVDLISHQGGILCMPRVSLLGTLKLEVTYIDFSASAEDDYAPSRLGNSVREATELTARFVANEALGSAGDVNTDKVMGDETMRKAKQWVSHGSNSVISGLNWVRTQVSNEQMPGIDFARGYASGVAQFLAHTKKRKSLHLKRKEKDAKIAQKREKEQKILARRLESTRRPRSPNWFKRLFQRFEGGDNSAPETKETKERKERKERKDTTGSVVAPVLGPNHNVFTAVSTVTTTLTVPRKALLTTATTDVGEDESKANVVETKVTNPKAPLKHSKKSGKKVVVGSGIGSAHLEKDDPLVPPPFSYPYDYEDIDLSRVSTRQSAAYACLPLHVVGDSVYYVSSLKYDSSDSHRNLVNTCALRPLLSLDSKENYTPANSAKYFELFTSVSQVGRKRGW